MLQSRRLAHTTGWRQQYRQANERPKAEQRRACGGREGGAWHREVLFENRKTEGGRERFGNRGKRKRIMAAPCTKRKGFSPQGHRAACLKFVWGSGGAACSVRGGVCWLRDRSRFASRSTCCICRHDYAQAAQRKHADLKGLVRVGSWQPAVLPSAVQLGTAASDRGAKFRQVARSGSLPGQMAGCQVRWQVAHIR